MRNPNGKLPLHLVGERPQRIDLQQGCKERTQTGGEVETRVLSEGRGSRTRCRRRSKTKERCMERWGEREAPVFSLKLTLVSEEDGCINQAEKQPGSVVFISPLSKLSAQARLHTALQIEQTQHYMKLKHGAEYGVHNTPMQAVRYYINGSKMDKMAHSDNHAPPHIGS